MWERSIRWLGIGLPLALVLSVESLHFLMEGRSPVLWEHVSITTILSIGVLSYGSLMTISLIRMRRKVLRLYQETAAHRDQLEALHSAGLAVTGNLDVATVLSRVAELGRTVVDAERISLTLAHSADAPYQPSEMDMEMVPCHKQALRVPMLFRGELLGHLEVSGKRAGLYTPADEQVLQSFAACAAIAVANARLYAGAERLATLEERERIAMDLHDGTIQSLYGIELLLEDTARQISKQGRSISEATVAERVEVAVDGIGRVLGDIRHYIFALRSEEGPSPDLGRDLAQLVRETCLGTSARITLNVSPEVEGRLDPETSGLLLRVAREALSNALKHAKASRISITVADAPGWVRLQVADDGVGFHPEVNPGAGHDGLQNMRERAAAAGGLLQVASTPGAGCEVLFSCPVERRAKAEEGDTEHVASAGGR